MTKEEACRAIDAIQLALGSDRRVGIFDDGRLWEIKSLDRKKSGDYQLSCAYFGAVRQCWLSELNIQDIFISL